MIGPSPEVAAVRVAVRRALAAAGCPPGTPLLVACSGGADSTALAAAAAHLSGVWPARAAVVDHGLQSDSAEVAARTKDLLDGLGLPTEVLTVEVTGPGGVEAAARRARYTALRAARPAPVSPVLLGHTLDDQAETVLLGLGRGSGARSLAGMSEWSPPWLRPLLGLRRAVTRAACDALDLPVWDDPHNADRRFTRVRLRREVLPLLEDVLAGGVAEALGRTAAQLAEDGAALDDLAAAARSAAERPALPAATPTGTPHAGAPEAGAPEAGAPEAGAPEAGALAAGALAAGALAAGALPAGALDTGVLGSYPAAVRRRALRLWLLDCGVRELTDAHLRAADDLVVGWRGQGGPMLPGGLELARRSGRLTVRPAGAENVTSRSSLAGSKDGAERA